MAYDRKSFYAMNKKRTNADQITYPFMDGEIVTIKRIRSENGDITFIEVRKSAEGTETMSPLSNTDMNDEIFTRIKESLVAIARKEDIADSKYTRKFTSIENVNKETASRESAEDEYIEKQDNQEKLLIEETDITSRTVDNALKILDLCLTDIQKQRFIRNKYFDESTRVIAQKEGKRQNAIFKSIALSEKKIKKFLESPKKGWSKRPENDDK